MYYSPLRYPGGKGTLAQYVGNLMEMNDLVGGHYAEPYAGGAGLAITLLYLEYAEHIHLNDLNLPVYSFWKVLKDEPESFCRLIRDTPVTVDEWQRQKAVQADTSSSTLELGFSTFFLNRTNRSGIIAGGMIGGKGQAGVWKLDARYNRADLALRAEKIARFASRISIYNLDAADFIAKEIPKIPKNSLIYLDPPYYMKGMRLYQNHYKYHDHAAIADVAKRIIQKWIVSYDNVEPIRKLYDGCKQEVFNIRYTARESRSGSEVMIFGPDIKSPGEIEVFRGIAA